jgi:hypothetical protein
MSVALSELIEVEPISGRDLKTSANVVDVGAWMATAKALRKDLAYVPRHRRPGPAV